MKFHLLTITIVLSFLVLLPLVPEAGTDSSSAYKEILNELTSKSKTVSPYKLADTALKLFTGFLEKYPYAPEVPRVYVNLGRVLAGAGRYREAIRYLENFLSSGGGKIDTQRVAALHMLGMCRLALEEYDEAERIFKGILESDAQLGGRTRESVSKELARIGTLKKLKIGALAIEFSVRAANGKMISLSDYRGRVVLLDFWASWCNPCRKEMPNVKRAYNEFHSKGFEIIGISLDRSENKFESYVNEQRLPWPQIFDGKGWNSKLGSLYAVNAIPASFLLDREGRIRYKNVRGSRFKKAVSSLISEAE